MKRLELLEILEITEFETKQSSQKNLEKRLNSLKQKEIKDRCIIFYANDIEDLEDFKNEVLRCGFGYEFIPRYESPRCGNANPAQVKIFW